VLFSGCGGWREWIWSKFSFSNCIYDASLLYFQVTYCISGSSVMPIFGAASIRLKKLNEIGPALLRKQAHAVVFLIAWTVVLVYIIIAVHFVSVKCFLLKIIDWQGCTFLFQKIFRRLLYTVIETSFVRIVKELSSPCCNICGIYVGAVS